MTVIPATREQEAGGSHLMLAQEKSVRPYLKNRRAGGAVPEVEHLPMRCKALNKKFHQINICQESPNSFLRGASRMQFLPLLGLEGKSEEGGICSNSYKLNGATKRES
jgi:hypothetical protein